MEQEGERLSADIDFPKVLFLHINRVAQSPSDETFSANVEMLESLLCPYFDMEYYVDLKIPEKEYRNIQSLDHATHGREQMLAQKHSVVTRDRFRALMKLANRRNLLIQKTDYGEDESDGDTKEA